MAWEILLDNGYDNYGSSLAATSDDGYIVAGYSWTDLSGVDDYDVWLVRLASETGISGPGPDQGEAPVITGVFPNPSTGIFTVSIVAGLPCQVSASVYALDGSLVSAPDVLVSSAGEGSLTWNGTDLQGNPVPSGVYLVRVEASGLSAAARMVLVR
jgi:hypothetical protein